MTTRFTGGILRQSEEWYACCRDAYDSLTKIVCGTLEGLLKERRIDYLSVSGRAKTLDSFVQKIRRKGYTDPKTQIHDLAGVRVITYIESDVEKTVQLIRAAFNVHPDKSLDKTSELGIDRIGYRSVHLVCDLGPDRVALLEYAPYRGMLIEIQVRTVLQHAWAEIEHDRNYKFAGVLPPHFQRRLHLAAGTLEMVDHEFDGLAKSIDEYARSVAQETKKGNLDIQLDTPSLAEYLKTRFGHQRYITLGRLSDSPILAELAAFGVTTLAQVDALLTPTLLSRIKKQKVQTTDVGLLRSAMMYADVERYFKSAWRHHWNFTGPSEVRLLSAKYSPNKINALFKAHKIEVSEAVDESMAEKAPNHEVHRIPHPQRVRKR